MGAARGDFHSSADPHMPTRMWLRSGLLRAREGGRLRCISTALAIVRPKSRFSLLQRLRRAGGAYRRNPEFHFKAFIGQGRMDTVSHDRASFTEGISYGEAQPRPE